MPRFKDDTDGYYKFTGPARLDKALNTLEGLLGAAHAKGTAQQELSQYQEWMDEHADLFNRHPFDEIAPRLIDVLDNDVLDPAEVDDMLWLCAKLRPGEPYYAKATQDMQILHGLMRGVIADGVVTMEELDTLTHWMGQHEHLKTCWPYDEVGSLITEVRRDGAIDEREQKMLIQFFGEFCAREGHYAISATNVDVNIDDTTPISGLCAVCPEISFMNRAFCWTGASELKTRNEITEIVVGRGGTFSNSVSKKLDYLVIGAAGNPCWAYSCYGRKVEQAMNYRRDGAHITLVHEHDFWDAAKD